MTILYLWTVVAMNASGIYVERDWRPIGEFRNEQACIRAAATLGIDKARFRCVATA